MFRQAEGTKEKDERSSNSLMKPLMVAALRDSGVPLSKLEIVENVPRMLLGFSVWM